VITIFTTGVLPPVDESLIRKVIEFMVCLSPDVNFS
jgi:hypothetical protein